jgi:hypothetical protein
VIPDAKTHARNGGLAKNKKPEKQVYHAREVEFQLVQNEAGEWYLQFGGSESLFPATDVEVALWLRVKKLEEMIANG